MEYFANIGKIKYEGKNSTNPLAFKFYNPDEIIGGKTMQDIRAIAGISGKIPRAIQIESAVGHHMCFGIGDTNAGGK